MKTPVILIVDDEESIIDTLKGSLEDDGHIVITASDGMKALEIIKSQSIDIVFLDIWLPEMDGLTTLRAIKDFNSSIEVVMMTGHGTVNTAVLAIKDGAFDFLEKPFSLDAVFDIINKITKKQQSPLTNAKKDEEAFAEEGKLALTGKNQSIIKIKRLIPKIARSNEDVLLVGQAGTGKGVCFPSYTCGFQKERQAVDKNQLCLLCASKTGSHAVWRSERQRSNMQQ